MPMMSIIHGKIKMVGGTYWCTAVGRQAFWHTENSNGKLFAKKSLGPGANSSPWISYYYFCKHKDFDLIIIEIFQLQSTEGPNGRILHKGKQSRRLAYIFEPWIWTAISLRGQGGWNLNQF